MSRGFHPARFFDPLSPALHICLAAERAVLLDAVVGPSAQSDAIVGAAGRAVGAAVPAGAPAAIKDGAGYATDTARCDTIVAGVRGFAQVMVSATRAIREESASTSHIWAHDVYGAVVVHPEHRDAEGVVLPALAYFDAIAHAWEALVVDVVAVAASPVDIQVRYFTPLLHADASDGGILYRRGALRRVYFVNCLFAICVEAMDLHLFRVQPRTNRAELVVTPLERASASRFVASAPAVVRARFYYIAAAAAVVVLRRVRDQASSQTALAAVTAVQAAPLNGGAGAAGHDGGGVAAGDVVLRAVGAVWRLLLMIRGDAAAARQGFVALYAFVSENDHRRLSYPRVPFFSVFSVAVRLVDELLTRLQRLPASLQAPNDLVHVHEAVFKATSADFEGLLKSLIVPGGWTPKLLRALWRMFVRYALLVAVPQAFRRGTSEDATNPFAGSASFRQVIGVFGSSGSTSGRDSFSREEPLPTLAAAAATVTGVVQAAAPPPQQEMIPLASATTRADVSLDAVSLALLAQPGDEGVSSEHTQADAAEGPSAAAAALRIDDGHFALMTAARSWTTHYLPG